MLESKLDRNLHWKSPETLKSMGYWRDEIGQIRRSKDNALICAISGRAHFHHLVFAFNYENTTSDVDFYFIDEDCVGELLEKAKVAGAKILNKGKSRLIDRALRFAAEVAFGFAMKKFKGLF